MKRTRAGMGPARRGHSGYRRDVTRAGEHAEAKAFGRAHDPIILT